MSTRVTPEEYGTLKVAQRSLPDGIGFGLCDTQPSHGMATVMMVTPDQRAIHICGTCESFINEIQRNLQVIERKRNEL